MDRPSNVCFGWKTNAYPIQASGWSPLVSRRITSAIAATTMIAVELLRFILCFSIQGSNTQQITNARQSRALMAAFAIKFQNSTAHAGNAFIEKADEVSTLGKTMGRKQTLG
jgi:hypothetical protein